MTIVSWDHGIERAHERIHDELMRLVLDGTVYQAGNGTWYRRVTDAQRTTAYGVFPPVEGRSAIALDDLLQAERVYVDQSRSTYGLHPVVAV